MRRIGVALGVAFLVVFCLAPFLWTVLTSVKPGPEVFAMPPTYLPRALSAENYTGVLEQRPFARYLLNSLIVAAASTALALTAGALAAYGIARLRMRAAGTIEKGIFLFALFPPAILLAPLRGAVLTVGLMNSYVALILVHAALNVPFAVWMLAAFFRQMPKELEDAARVDGFSRLQILSRIVLPVSAPALAATAILVFIFSWNEFVIALAFMTRDEMRTLPVGISLLSGATAYEIPWGQICAAVVMTTLPVTAAVLAFQRWIISGLTAGAVKG
ncbi:MAG: carbohydrate ABC transporter permease [Acidobacteria bacterium]|nr:carbohydrate ABC transporter permease [Acidobacteriota bacterium]